METLTKTSCTETILNAAPENPSHWGDVSHGGQHRNATMLDLGSTTSLEVFHASVGRETCGIPETHGRLHAEFILEGAQRRMLCSWPSRPKRFQSEPSCVHGSHCKDRRQKVVSPRYHEISTFSEMLLWLSQCQYIYIYICLDESNDMIQHDVIWYGVICKAICAYTFGHWNEYHSSNLPCLCACFDSMISNSQPDPVTTLSRYSLQLTLLVSVCKYTSDIAL